MPKTKPSSVSLNLLLSDTHQYLSIHQQLIDKNSEKALQSCLDWIKKQPKNAEAQHLLGLSYLQLKKRDKAIQHLSQAIEFNSKNPQYEFNYAETLRQDLQLDLAIKHFSQAIKLRSDYSKAYYNRGCAYFSKGQFLNALKDFEQALITEPENTQWLTASADALREQGKFKEALNRYQKVLTINPDLSTPHSHLSAVLLQMGFVEKAFEHSQKAVKLAPQNAICQLNMGGCLVQMEQLDEAMDAFANAYELNPDSARICSNIGHVWSEILNTEQAFYWYQLALQKEPENIEALCGLARALRQAGKVDEAENELLALLDEYSDDYRLYAELGRVYWDQENSQKAIKYLNKAVTLRPTIAQLQVNIGSILASMGKIDEAIKAYQKALSQNSYCISALSGIATALGGKLKISKVKQLHKALRKKHLKEGSLASIHSGLAYYYDGIKNYSKAAEHLEQANHLYWEHKTKRGWKYDTKQHQEHIKNLKQTFNLDFFKKTKGFGLDSIIPVFIVGMPRSGTTLTEQILASHPRVLGIGERNFASLSISSWLDKKSPDGDFTKISQIKPQQIQEIGLQYLNLLINEKEKSGKTDILHIVDKMPDNYELLGWLATIFPQAHFIHCQRDVRDIALSCWMTQFDLIRWAFNLDHLAERIVSYQDIMAHWKQVLPVPVLESHYEKLVSNPQVYAKKLVEWLGLEWNEECLNFQKNKKIVRTASVIQVRKPIYTGSVARWKNYEEALAPLLSHIIKASEA